MVTSHLFNSTFNNSDFKIVANELKFGKGYFVFEEALTDQTVSAINSAAPIENLLVNSNNLGYVRAHWAKYLSHTLALSKECYDVVTSENIRSVCRNFFDNPYKISNQRIYETHTKSHLPWHTDNNLQTGNKYKGKHNLPGLMFLFYLSDVSETNPFQLIPDSHKWSEENNERFFTETFIEQNHGDNIVTVKAAKGTLILCNSHLIHRAEPFNKPGFSRLTYLFQVDEMSDEHLGHGERVLINPSFIDDTNPEILAFLGFGSRADYPAFPETSVATMLPDDMFALQKGILPKAFRGLMISLAKNIIPGAIINNFRKRIRS